MLSGKQPGPGNAFIRIHLSTFIAVFIAALGTFSESPAKTRSDNDSLNATTSYGSGDNSILDFYQRWISDTKGGNTCPMYPSCSQYSKMVFERYSPLWAYASTCQRLIECGRDHMQYNRIRIGGESKLLDVPEGADNEKEQKTANPPAHVIPMNTESIPPHALGDSLVKLGDMPRAAQAYLSCIYWCPEQTEKHVCLRKFFNSIYSIYSVDDFYLYFIKLGPYYQHNESLATELRLLLAKKYYLGGRYADAISHSPRLTASTDSSMHNQIRFIRTASLVRRHKWDEALELSRELPKEQRYENLKERLRTINKLGPKLKSPMLGGIMSALVPGAGYLYYGRTETALAALIINGLCIWSTVELCDRRLYGPAATAALFGTGWYLGTIRGSIKGVLRYNREKEKVLADGVLEGVQFRIESGF
jgi:putative component of membrane protein insertase Oxa1/YidC/SpoIIIJ protein YidD